MSPANNRCAGELRSGCGWLLIGLCLAASANFTSQTQVTKTESESLINGNDLQSDEGSTSHASNSNLESKINQFYGRERVNRGSLDYRGPYFGTRGKKSSPFQNPAYWGSNQYLWGKVPYAVSSKLTVKPNELQSTINDIRTNKFEHGTPGIRSAWGSNQAIWGRRKREDGGEGPFWVSRGKRSDDEGEGPFWVSRGKRDSPDSRYWGSNQPPYSNNLKELKIMMNRLGAKRSPESDFFWATRGQKVSDIMPFTAVRGKKSKQDFWTMRGKKDEDNNFWSARGKKEDGSKPFWLARGKKDDQSKPFWLARGKKEDQSKPFWLARGKKEDQNKPFWLARGKKDDDLQPFWLARGKKEDGKPFWLARGKKGDEIQPFWLARGKKDDIQPFWLARGKKDNVQPFWLSRGKKDDEEIDKRELNNLTQNSILVDKKQNSGTSFGVSRDSKDKFKYIWNIPGKKEDLSSNPFWVVRGRRAEDKNSNIPLKENEKLLMHLIHELIRKQNENTTSKQSLRNKKYGLLSTLDTKGYEKNFVKHFVPVRG